MFFRVYFAAPSLQGHQDKFLYISRTNAASFLFFSLLRLPRRTLLYRHSAWRRFIRGNDTPRGKALPGSVYIGNYLRVFVRGCTECFTRSLKPSRCQTNENNPERISIQKNRYLINSFIKNYYKIL